MSSNHRITMIISLFSSSHPHYSPVLPKSILYTAARVILGKTNYVMLLPNSHPPLVFHPAENEIQILTISHKAHEQTPEHPSNSISSPCPLTHLSNPHCTLLSHTFQEHSSQGLWTYSPLCLGIFSPDSHTPCFSFHLTWLRTLLKNVLLRDHFPLHHV